MNFFFRYSFILCVLLYNNQYAFSQCGVFVDTTTITHTTCNTTPSGSASLLSSSTFLNYSWNNITNGQNYGNGVNFTTVNNLDAGFYVVTGTIPFGSCPSIMYSDTFEILDTSSLNIDINVIDTIKCYGDLAGIDVITFCGSGWYHYSLEYWSLILAMWLPFSQQTTYDTATFIFIPANNYRIVVTDLATNNTTQALINITQPSALSLSISPTPATCYGTCDGVAAVSVSGGTPSYSLLWSNGLTNYVITGLCAGSYNLTVTDSNNCVESSSVIITEPNPLSFQPINHY